MDDIKMKKTNRFNQKVFLYFIQGILFIWMVYIIIRDGLFQSSLHVFLFLIFLLFIWLIPKKSKEKVSLNSVIWSLAIIVVYYALHFFFGFYP